MFLRRADVEAVGGYRSGWSVSNDLIGGVEDLEILQRLWKAGRRGVYVPGMAFQHKVPASRATKRYHRRWHTGHGRFYARLRDPEFERSKARLLDVPVHLYRATARTAVEWLAWKLRRREREAFACEARLCFFAGFFQERRQSLRSSS
jgi:GT2 family glycosyltransferase